MFSPKDDTNRFIKLPLCKKDCEDWFDACRTDVTCSKTFTYDGMDTNRPKTCDLKNNDCVSFETMYGNAYEMCETVTYPIFVYNFNKDQF